jgi:hypothetical protein
MRFPHVYFQSPADIHAQTTNTCEKPPMANRSSTDHTSILIEDDTRTRPLRRTEVEGKLTSIEICLLRLGIFRRPPPEPIFELLGL